MVIDQVTERVQNVFLSNHLACIGFWVQGLGFTGLDFASSGLRVRGIWFRGHGAWQIWVQGLGNRVEGSHAWELGLRVSVVQAWGLGLKVSVISLATFC